MLKKIFSTFVLRIIGAAIAYASSILITRNLGVEQTGQYFLATSALALLTVISTLGFNNVIVRNCSAFSSSGQYDETRKILLTALLYSCLFAVIIAILLFSGFYLFGFIDTKPETLQIILFISGAIVFSSAISLLASFFQSQHRASLSVLTLNINNHLMMILLVGFFSLFYELSSSSTLILLTIAMIVNSLIAIYKTGYFSFNRTEVELVKLPEWRAFWLNTIAVASLSHGIMLVASPNLPYSDIGIIGAAQRAAVLVAFILAAVNMITTPRYSEIYHSGDLDRLRVFSQKATLMMTLLALPVLLFILYFAEYIMGFFGEEFSSGYKILWIICASQFFNVSFGSVSPLLNMTGNAKDCKNVNLYLVAPFLILTYFSSQYYGVMGVAATLFLIQFIQNFVLYLFVYKRLGFSTINLNIRNLLK